MKRFLIPIFFVFLIIAACSSPERELPDYLVVQKNGLYGFINKQGSMTIMPQFAYARPFSEGLAAVNIGGNPVGKEMPTDGKWGFFGTDSSGQFKLVINPVFDSPPVLKAPIYDTDSISLAMHEAYIFSEGFSAVFTQNQWRYINRKGKLIAMDDRLVVRSVRRFSNGLAAYYNGQSWGYLSYDSKAKRIKEHISPQFVLPVDFQGGYAFVMTEDNERKVINLKGESVMIDAPYQFESNIINGYAAVKPSLDADGSTPSNEKKIGFYHIKSKKKNIPPQFDKVGHFSSGLCPVLVGSQPLAENQGPEEMNFADSRGGKWGFIDSTGHFVINPIYDDARSFSEGLAAVKIAHHWGFINVDGEEVFPPRFKQVGYFQRGVARVKMGSLNITYFNKDAYINRSGDVIWIDQE